ncbi:MAG: hypothetical protein HY062_08860 [Bacteroidetes bacterium]|nr:hypothetical protein [Bacteroidota bacterium]
MSLGIVNSYIHAQEWSLKLRSSVELRTFKLTNKADIREEKLAGATIALYKGSSVINQIQSDANGDFVIDVPANGEFILTVTYPGCNAKKFAISTLGVPEEIQKDNYKPTFGIEGVIMAKAFPTIDYSILKQPLVRIGYVSNGKKFDDEELYTNQMLAELRKMRDAENALIERFTSTNTIGDVALSKGDCPLAKASYEKAMTIIPGESYPGDQLVKVGDCLKSKELAEKKAAAEAQAAKLAAEESLAKAAAEKQAKELEASKKAETERVAKQKVTAEKLAKEKAAQEKLQNAKQLAEQSAKAKETSDKLAKEKTIQDKQVKQKTGTVTQTKTESPKTGKEKTTTPAKQQNNGLVSSNPSGAVAESKAANAGDAKYSIPQALGVDKYKATIKRADELFKMKRYSEAKPIYEEALKQKANDVYATSKLAEIEQLIKK